MNKGAFRDFRIHWPISRGHRLGNIGFGSHMIHNQRAQPLSLQMKHRISTGCPLSLFCLLTETLQPSKHVFGYIFLSWNAISPYAHNCSNFCNTYTASMLPVPQSVGKANTKLRVTGTLVAVVERTAYHVILMNLLQYFIDFTRILPPH